MTSCGSWRRRSWPRRSRGRRCRRRRWCMRRICGWWTCEQGPALEQPRAFLCRGGRGHAADPGRTGPPQEESPKHGGDVRAQSTRRYGDRSPEPAVDDLLAVDEALEQLADASTTSAAELVKLRYFAGLTIQQAAEVAGHFAQQLPTAIGLTPGPGCSRELSTTTRRLALKKCHFGILSRCGAPRFRTVSSEMSTAESGMTMTADTATNERSSWRRLGQSHRPEQREAFLDEACGGRSAMLRRSVDDSAAGPRRRAGSFLETRPPCRSSTAPSTSRPSKSPAPRSAPTSCCSKSAKAAWASSTWPSRREPVQRHGGAQDHQAGHGHAAGDRPLRGRAAGPGADGPSEHRQGARRRARPTAAGPTS